ncbi:MAG: hypothetical protein ACYCTY_11110 [Sulfuricella sp.]
MMQNNYSDVEGFDFGDELPAAALISPFQGYGATKFEQWLEEGLKGYLLEGKGAWGFPGAEDRLAAHSMLLDGLKAFYGSLDGAMQGQFKEAVANLLASMPPEARFIPLFSTLLSLASILPAPQVLRVLPQRIGNGYFGFARNAEGGSLFDIALLSVARLAAPRKDALDCLHALISSSRFDAAYTGIALIALCQADDTHFDRHMKLMRPHLQAMYAKYGKGVNAKRTWAEQVLEVIPLNRLAVALPKLKYFDAKSELAPLDTWLLDGLFGGRKPLLKCAKSEGGTLLLFPLGLPEKAKEIPLQGKNVGDMLQFFQEKEYIDQNKAKLERDQDGKPYIHLRPFDTAGQDSRIRILGLDAELIQGIDPDVAESFGLMILRSDRPRRSSGIMSSGVPVWQGG